MPLPSSRVGPRALRIERGTAVLVTALAILAVLACGPPPFLVHVTFPGELDVEEGAPVLYGGVRVGEVQRVALRQEDPERAALVALTLAIDDRSIQLRAADRFHIASLRGVSVVEVEPSAKLSPPLEDGVTVAGVPPVLTRIEDEIGHAIESIGKAALQAVDEAIKALERSDTDAPEGQEAGGAAPPSQPTPVR